MQIQFFGCGNMGQVMLQAFVTAKYKQSDIRVSERDSEKIKNLKKKYTVNFGITPEADIVILAVKPQQIGDINFSVFVKKPLIFSIMAGVTIKKLQQISKSTSIIRAIPNLPISVSKWVMWYLQNKKIDAKKMGILKKVFAPLCHMIEVKNEDQIEKITALSWSWPAYFYYLTELIQQQAEKFGFTSEQAEMIAKHTYIGSAKLLETSWLAVSQLKKNVTSKWWTTEAALETMKKKWMDKAVQAGIIAAYKRAKKLSK